MVQRDLLLIITCNVGSRRPAFLFRSPSNNVTARQGNEITPR